jgi:hypothetical protein
MSHRATATLLVSLLGHALVFSIGLSAAREEEAEARWPAMAPGPVIAAGAAVVERAARLDRARRALVDEARADLKNGKLALGRFLLRANRIDAEALGQEIDFDEAEARFEARLRALREALERDDVRHAVPAVFGDLRYVGQPGGFMGSALLEEAGSCEQVAELVVAAVFDAGRPGEIALRHYGRPMDDGVAHVTPVALRGADELDLMTGRPAIPGGMRVQASELVEIYARAHGLAPELTSAGGSAGTGVGTGTRAGAGAGAATGTGTAAAPERPERAGPSRPTLARGFPPNNDRYPGALPLYAARALREPTDDPEEPFDAETAKDQALNCAYFLRMAMLSPPLVEVQTSLTGHASGVAMEPYRIPKPVRLEREAMLLSAAESLAESESSNDADRIMGWACVAALGESAAVDFTLAGERRFAEAAIEKHRRAREEGRKALASIRWSSEEGQRIAARLSQDFGGRTWILLALEGGDDVVFGLIQKAHREDWGRVSSLAALALWPGSRSRALGLIETLPARDQVEVMHEIFHAHDHMRPWATNFDFGDEEPGAPGAAFRKVYRVFRGAAWRLWEGHREVGEIFAALRSEASRAGISDAWEAALIEYCGRNALGLYSQRAKGMDLVRALKKAVEESGHPSLATLRRQIDHIESQGLLDARTLADAMRLR